MKTLNLNQMEAINGGLAMIACNQFVYEITGMCVGRQYVCPPFMFCIM